MHTRIQRCRLCRRAPDYRQVERNITLTPRHFDPLRRARWWCVHRLPRHRDRHRLIIDNLTLAGAPPPGAVRRRARPSVETPRAHPGRARSARCTIRGRRRLLARRQACSRRLRRVESRLHATATPSWFSIALVNDLDSSAKELFSDAAARITAPGARSAGVSGEPLGSSRAGAAWSSAESARLRWRISRTPRRGRADRPRRSVSRAVGRAARARPHLTARRCRPCRALRSICSRAR